VSPLQTATETRPARRGTCAPCTARHAPRARASNRKPARTRHCERGQNLIEFAFLMPLLIVMIGAIIMIAFALFTRSNLQQAVREGARQAAVGRPLTEVQNLAAGNSGGTLDPGEIRWCLPSGSSGNVGQQIRVYVDEGNDGSEGYGITIIPSTGIFSAMGVSPVSTDLAPRATARLERNVTGVPACGS
jgi:hypothetical protein